MADISFPAHGRISSLHSLAAAVLLGLSTGLALAEGDSGGFYAYQTMQQVQTGSYGTQIDQNGEQRFLGR